MASGNTSNDNMKGIRVATGVIFRIIIVILVVMLFYGVLSVGYDFGHDLFAGETVSGADESKDVEFTVSDGESLTTVTKHLKKAGLIKSELKYRCLLIFFDKQAMPGTYTFNTSMTSKEIMKYLDAGPESLEE